MRSTGGFAWKRAMRTSLMAPLLTARVWKWLVETALGTSRTSRSGALSLSAFGVSGAEARISNATPSLARTTPTLVMLMILPAREGAEAISAEEAVATEAGAACDAIRTANESEPSVSFTSLAAAKVSSTRATSLPSLL